MCGTAFAFVYAGGDGTDETIDLQAMRRIWVDRASTGIVFAEPTPDGVEMLHEIVLDDPGATQAMIEVMETLLAATSFERIEQPVGNLETSPLVLEFRYPQVSQVALALRA
jgi:hypothetical protein